MSLRRYGLDGRQAREDASPRPRLAEAEAEDPPDAVDASGVRKVGRLQDAGLTGATKQSTVRCEVISGVLMPADR